MNTTLALYSLYAVYSGMAVLALAMIAYVSYLAGLMPTRTAAKDAARAAAEAPAATRELASVGGKPGSQTGPPAGSSAGSPPEPASAAAAPSAPEVPARARKAAGIASMLTNLAALLVVAGAVLRGLAVHRMPLGNMYEFALMTVSFLLVAYAAWSMRRDLRWLGFFVVAPALLTLGLATTIWYTEASRLMPSLRSYWLVIHVTIATLTVALFAIGAVLAGLYLWQDRVERAGKPSLLNRFPTSRALEKLTYQVHVIAFPLWTFTVIAGAIWARQAWGSYWNWDPKEVWSFVIWVVYAAYLHARVTSGWRRQNAALIALAGFACIIINYAVVNVYFVGQHSYSGL
ncbi:MAG: c-type cytochrome biogenesis protein CcsB [Phycicoccus sp.]|nr:c-type cytochrome biogenesis protein CcsB [Phycicoccus sp.]